MDDTLELLLSLVKIDRYFGITNSLIGNGCEHGFKPAGSCPNQHCEAREAQEAWLRVCQAIGDRGQ